MLSDETLLLIEKFKSLNQEIPVVISKNRYKASKVCLQDDIYVNLQDIYNNNETEIDFLSHCAYGETHDKYEKYKRVCILDDGFTALNIKKDLNIVLIDGTKNLFKQFVIPAGILREPMSSIKYSNCIIISKTVKSNPLLETEIRKYNNSCPIFYSYYAPTSIKGGLGGKETISCQNISGGKAKKVIIISGIGNPEYFYYNIKSCGFEIVYNFEYNDHYKYKDKDLLNIKIKLDNYLNNKHNNKNNKYVTNIKSDKHAKNDKHNDKHNKNNDKNIKPAKHLQNDKYLEDVIIITTLKDYVKLKEFKLKYPEIIDKLYYLDFEVKIDNKFYDFIIDNYLNYIGNTRPELVSNIKNSIIKKNEKKLN
ncbi:MAG: tetraacyldisaccharide 4'-kinase [bacterium]